MALAIAAFVYRKHLVETLINTEITLNVFPSAMAQPSAIEHSPQTAGFVALASEHSSITPRPGLLGFELQGIVESVPEDCEDAVSPFFLSAFALADISDEDFFIKVNRCLRQNIEGKKWMVSFGPLQVPLTSGEKALVEKVQDKLSRDHKLIDLIDKDLQEMDFADPSNISKLAAIVNRLEASDNLLSRIARIYVYSNLGNQGMAEKLAKEYLDKTEYELFFETEYFYKNPEEIGKRLANMLGKAQKRMGKNNFFDAFALKLYGEASETMREAMESELNLPLAKKQVLGIIKSPLIGIESPLAWTWWALENLDKQGQDELFEKVPVSSSSESLQVLRYHYPSTGHRREGFGKAIEKLPSLRLPERGALYFEILKNDEWRKYLTSSNGGKLKPLFRQKREFYTKTFSKDRGILFSAYNLFQLGDFQREHFLKILAIRIYGLPAAQILPL